MLSDIDAGRLNYRDMAKKVYSNGGKRRRFSISQISKIKASRDGKWGEIHEKPSEGVLAAKVFGMFQVGRTPAQIVISEKLPPTVVSDLFNHFVTMAKQIVLPESAKNRLAQRGYHISSASDLDGVTNRLLSDSEMLHGFTYPCAGCGQQVQASPNQEWKSLVSKGALWSWRHDEC